MPPIQSSTCSDLHFWQFNYVILANTESTMRAIVSLIFFLLFLTTAQCGVNFIRTTFTDAQCTEPIGYVYTYNSQSCVEVTCTQWGSTSQYWTIKCDLPLPVNETWNTAVITSTQDCNSPSTVYSSPPGTCFIYQDASSLSALILSECSGGQMSVDYYTYSDGCGVSSGSTNFTTICSNLNLIYGQAICAGAYPAPPSATPIATPIATPVAETPVEPVSNTPLSTPVSNAPVSAPVSNTPPVSSPVAKKSDARNNCVGFAIMTGFVSFAWF